MNMANDTCDLLNKTAEQHNNYMLYTQEFLKFVNDLNKSIAKSLANSIRCRC